MIVRMSGLISLPFSKNQRILVAEVGKSGSQSALASSQVPWPNACCIGSGGVTWPTN